MKTYKTAILTDALNAWIERKGAQELDKQFGHRLNRQSRAIDRIERKVDALTELVGVFVQHHLSSTAHQPDIGREAANLGLLASTSCSILSSSVSPKAAALHA